MGKLNKFLKTPGLYWRDYFLKKYPVQTNRTSSVAFDPINSEGGEDKRKTDDLSLIPFRPISGSKYSKSLVCIYDLCRLPYILPILLNINPDNIVLFLGDARRLEAPIVKKLLQIGVKVIDDQDELSNYKYFIIDSKYMYNSSLMEKYIHRDADLIIFRHSTDALGGVSVSRCRRMFSGFHFILSNESVFKSISLSYDTENTCVNNNKYFCFKNSKFEFTYTGLFHLDYDDDDITDDTMLKILGPKYNKNLKTVFYYEDEFCDLHDVYKGLNRLADEFNVIVKPWCRIKRNNDTDKFFISQEDGVIWGRRIRDFADVVLTGPKAGTTATALMLGQRVIPTYTLKCNERNESQSPEASYLMHLISNHKIHDRANMELSPLHILDTDTIISRIKDDRYWKEYASNFSELQKNVFGDYKVSGAAKETADCIQRILDTGSFIPRG